VFGRGLICASTGNHSSATRHQGEDGLGAGTPSRFSLPGRRYVVTPNWRNHRGALGARGSRSDRGPHERLAFRGVRATTRSLAQVGGGATPRCGMPGAPNGTGTSVSPHRGGEPLSPRGGEVPSRPLLPTRRRVVDAAEAPRDAPPPPPLRPRRGPPGARVRASPGARSTVLGPVTGTTALVPGGFAAYLPGS